MMKTITVFMSTYNGEKYVEEQIESILNQKNVLISLLVRDDGSKDGTIDILKRYQSEGKLKFVSGENIGYGKSFLSLFCTVEEDTDYYAYADQDDVWDEEKLNAAITCLESIHTDKGKLYFSNLKIVDEDQQFIKEKSFDNIKITLGGVYVRQRIAGCTIVFDRVLFHLADRINFDTYNYAISHEWVYPLCLAVGGEVYYDSRSFINYRRHRGAVTSIGNGIRGRIKNEMKQFGSLKNDKSELSKLLLTNYPDKIQENQKKLLKSIAGYRKNIFSRLALLFNPELDAGKLIFKIKNRICILFGVF